MRVFSARAAWRRLGAAVASTALLASLAACGGDGGGEVEGIKVIEKGKLTVCTHLPYKPFQYENKNGEVVGFDVDMLDLLAKDLGLEQTVVNMGAWKQVTSGAAFSAGKCDIGMGAMTITPERKKALLISDPYFDADQTLLVKKSSPIKDLSGLDGKTLGAQVDTTGESYAQEHAKQFGYTVRSYEDLALQLNALKAGTIDGAINDNGVVNNFVKDNPNTEVVKTFETNEFYGFPAKKDDPNAKKLIDRLNQVLAQAKKDGTYDQIYKKWFGVESGESASQ